MDINKTISIGFYTPDYDLNEDIFGCYTYGFSDTEVHANSIRCFPEKIEGVTCSGLYGECLANAESITDHIKAAIVFTENRGGENQFIYDLSKVIQCPIVGGGAARVSRPDDLQNNKAEKQASVFFITDAAVSVKTETLNIHDQIIGECTLELSDTRTIRLIDGIDGAAFLREKKRLLGIDPDDFEHLTISTETNVNAHLREEDGVLKSGRDLHKKMLMRYVKEEDAKESIRSFYEDGDENVIVFGCAGLRGIMGGSFSSKSLGAFLFGEICHINGASDFGNLMLSRLEIISL